MKNAISPHCELVEPNRFFKYITLRPKSLWRRVLICMQLHKHFLNSLIDRLKVSNILPEFD